MSNIQVRDLKFSPRGNTSPDHDYPPQEKDSRSPRSGSTGSYVRTSVLSPKNRVNPSYATFGSAKNYKEDLTESYKDLCEAQSPNSPYTDSTASTYALQVTLKNMKERYQKLQKKINVLEEENGRLINGKSELFGEIGKIQENSIKLREKNLRLNHEVHSQHSECCSLKDKYTSLNEENLKLCTQMSKLKLDKRRIQRQFDCITKENELLKDSLMQAVSHCKKIPGIPTESLGEWEVLSKSKKGLSSDLVDSLYNPSAIEASAFSRTFKTSKTKIIPSMTDLHSFDDMEQMSGILTELSTDDEEDGDDFYSLASIEKVTEGMAKITHLLQKQKEDLVELQPIILSCKLKEGNSPNIKSDECGNNRFTTGCLATYGSNHRSAHLLSNSSSNSEIEQLLSDGGGDCSIVLGKEREERSPFDWRNLRMDNDNNGHSRTMKDISTSPDMTLSCRHDSEQCIPQRLSSTDEEDRKCPMCYKVFPIDNVAMETFIQHVAGHFEQESGFQVSS